MAFTHFHVHSQYSILDGAASVPGLVGKAIADGMKAISLTDHGNMFGIKLFYDTCRKKGIKPILGVEAYVARESLYSKEKPVDRSGEHLIILAKNLKGYLNLVKLCSTAFVDGYYYRPRIDKALLEKYHEGLIISSACLGGEICQKIMGGDIEGAEAAALWYKNLVGEDYYLEVMRHPAESAKERAEVYDNQVKCNAEILRMGEKLGIKVIATNDVHFLNAEDAEAHDLLICLNTRKDLDDPNRMRYTRQEWFKTTAEMEELFKDIPQVIENTQEIVDKVEEYKLDSDPLMPVFPIPPEIGTEEEYRKKYTEEDLFNEFTRNEKGEVVMSEEDAQKKVKKLGGYDRLYRIKLEADYLKELAMKGAKRRYGENIPPDIMERLIFELHIMKTMGFPGYFLIVQDFIQAARDMGVIVGPGRGSAAGSAVAYSLGITNIDPVKYDLLFERFLNPDRISLPDIDVDFDDDGRQRVLEWVTQKYGADKVAHIVTFGSMAAKMAIKDVARVLKLDLSEANRLAKCLELKAYDFMLWFDKSFNGFETVGTAYDFIALCCKRCKVEFANKRAEIDAMPNGGVTLSVYTENDIETCRDVLFYVAQVLGGFFIINREGKLELRKYGKDPVMKVEQRHRFSSSFSDFITRYTAVSSTNKQTQIAEYYALDPDNGLTMNLGVNPLLQFGLKETREMLCRNILADLSVIRYVPFDSDTIGNPALDPGDVLTFTGGQADEGQITCITSIRQKIGGKQSLKCVGKNPRLDQAKSRNDKNISGLLNQIEDNAKTGKIGIHTFTNASAHEIGQTRVKLLSIQFASSEENHMQFFAQVVVDVDADPVERSAEASGTVVIPFPGGSGSGTGSGTGGSDGTGETSDAGSSENDAAGNEVGNTSGNENTGSTDDVAGGSDSGSGTGSGSEVSVDVSLPVKW